MPLKLIWSYGKKPPHNPFYRGRISATVYPVKSTSYWTYLLHSTDLRLGVVYTETTYPTQHEAMMAVEADIDRRLATAPTEEDMIDIWLEFQQDVERNR